MSAGPVLIVDDSRLVRESLARMFEHEGYGAVTAANGREAWATMYRQSPAAIVLDLASPQRDGVLFLRLLRGNSMWHGVPVLAINSTTLSEHLSREARKLGVQMMNKSDVSVDDMLDHVREAMSAEHSRETVCA